MATDVVAQEEQVADYVEDLVPGRLVGEAQAVVDRSARAEHQQIFILGTRAQALLLELPGFLLQEEGAAGR